MFCFGREEFNFKSKSDRQKLANYKMDDFRHNPYIGSFHAVPYKTEGTSSSGELVMSESKTNPMVGLFRHSPSMASNRVGLKSVIYDDQQLAFPIISRLRINSLPRSTLTGRTFLSSLRQIPVTVYSSSSSTASKSIVDIQDKVTTKSDLTVEQQMESDRNNHNVPMCAICLEEYADGDELLTLACSHCFHSECVNKWFYHGCINNAELQEAFRCPHCRQDHIALSEQCSHASGDIAIPSGSFLDVGQSLLRDGGYDFLSDAGSERSTATRTTITTTATTYNNNNMAAMVRPVTFTPPLPPHAVTQQVVSSPQKQKPLNPVSTTTTTTSQQRSLEESAYSDCGVPLPLSPSKI